LILLIEPFSKNVDMYVPAYPLPLVEIASFVKARIPTVEIEIRSLAMDYGLPIGSAGKALIYERLLTDIDRYEPTGIGISCTAIAQAEETLTLCDRIKARNPEIFIFLGGYFPSLYYAEIFARSRAVDLIVIGEGERPALEIIDRLEKGKNPKDDAVAGLVWQRDDRVHLTAPPRRFPLEQKALLNLSLLQRPDSYEILPYSFSRGCHYRCSFCMEDVLRPRHQKVPKNIVERDLADLSASTRAGTLLACDALFKSYDYFPLLQRLNQKINFETRCDTLDPALLEHFADVCGILALGLESASYDSLRRMNKIRDRAHYQSYLAQAEAIFKSAVKSEIPIMIFMIVGYPGDREQDVKQSLAFAQKLAARKGDGGYVFKVGETRLYPKTRIYEWAAAQPHVVFEEMGVFGENVVRQPSKDLTFATLEAYMQDIFSLSRSTPKLQERLGNLMPFFRIPLQVFKDESLPADCFLDGDREILNAQSANLAVFRESLSAVLPKYRTARAGQRSTRTLPL
jgi:radical SAM superfamily enzyme YgiQ (UPF0313 family)